MLSEASEFRHAPAGCNVKQRTCTSLTENASLHGSCAEALSHWACA